jgi:polyhydroxyalkanoate synthesis regulator phasin
MTPEEEQILKIALEQLDTIGDTVDTLDERLTRLEQQVADLRGHLE